MTEEKSAPAIRGVLETALYVEDMDRSATFFQDTLGLDPLMRSERLTVFDAGRNSVLLVFLQGASLQDMSGPDGVVPGHDGSGPLHMAFAIAGDDFPVWEKRLRDKGVPIRGEMAWPRGGRSLYFEDPDGHVLEFATPGLWPNY